MTILVAGHAVYVPLAVVGVIYHLLKSGKEDVYDLLLDLNMGEADAFRVTFDIKYLTEPTFEVFD
jgi:hypothetical protein